MAIVFIQSRVPPKKTSVAECSLTENGDGHEVSVPDRLWGAKVCFTSVPYGSNALATGARTRVSVGRNSVVRVGVEVNEYRSLVTNVKPVAESTVMQN